MRVSLPLAGLVARRFLSPTGLILLAGGILLAAFLPFSPSEARGAASLSAEVGAGLARQGVWSTGLCIGLAWFCAHAGQSVSRWRRGEGDWLGTSALSSGSIVWSHALGASLALAAALVPFAIAGEWRAKDHPPALRWLADESVPPVALLTETDRASLNVEPPAGASVAIARFVIAAPGSGGPSARVRCTLERSGAASVASETLVTNNTPMTLELHGGEGPARLSFERVGPGAVVVLEGPRLQWFERAPARWRVALALFLHAWLAGSAAAALALGVAAWTSPGTAFLSAFVLLSYGWLEERAPLAWPGVGLRDALELTGAGLGASCPAPATWLGCATVALLAPLLACAQRDLWRRES